MTNDVIEKYMRACMKDMTMFGTRVADVLREPVGKHFLSRVQPPEMASTIREWWAQMHVRGCYEPPAFGLGDSDWSMEPYDYLPVHNYVKDVYVEGFKPEMVLSAHAFGTGYLKSVIAVFGMVRNTGVCTVFLKHHCFFHTLWLLYMMYVENLVSTFCTVRTHGRVQLNGQSGSLAAGASVKVRVLGENPHGLLDYPRPVTLSVGMNAFRIQSYDDGRGGCISISMDLSLPSRVPAFKTNIPSLFDII